MARLLRMPEVAANTLEATLSEWLLAEAAEFADGDAIATVETDKAAVEVPAEGAGVLVRTLVGPGTTVAVGAPVALIAAPGEVIDDVDATLGQLGGTAAPATVDDPDAPVELAGQTPPTAVSGPPDPAGETAAPDGNGRAGRIMSSPLARRLVREHGLVLEDLTGTGPGGRIVRDDVRRAVAARDANGTAPATSRPAATPPAPPPAPAVPEPAAGHPAAGEPAPVQPGAGQPAAGRPGAGYEDVPHTRMRRAIASRLAESNREAPHFFVRGTARVDELLALRATLNAGGGPKISVNDLVVAAVARTHAQLPELNVVWTPDAVRRFATVDVGVAVATDRGLVTPVLRGADRLTVSAIARANADFAERARARTLRPDELEGGTVTVSNLGGYGTEEFTAVLNPPQATILAVGAARKEAVVDGGELAVATVLHVTLTVDHRPIDGATAARWMAAFLALLEQPLRILA
jgi:pyruvate dehydrogenase E2 component (dihydrolipoamide acetyltransferase)